MENDLCKKCGFPIDEEGDCIQCDRQPLTLQDQIGVLFIAVFIMAFWMWLFDYISKL